MSKETEQKTKRKPSAFERLRITLNVLFLLCSLASMAASYGFISGKLQRHSDGSYTLAAPEPKAFDVSMDTDPVPPPGPMFEAWEALQKKHGR
jgi:hypothetical protein